MVSFDMKTSIFIYILVSYICTYVMALTWYQSRKRAWGSEFFFADFLFISCGMTLAIFRGILPAFLTIVFANFLMFVGSIIFLFGMARFFNVPIYRKFYYIYAAIFIVLYAYFTYFQADFRIRIMLFSGMLIPVFAHIDYLIFFSKDAVHRRYAASTGATFILFIILYICRFYYAFSAGSLVGYFNTPMMDAFLNIISLILTILLVYSLQLMINGKLFHQAEMHAVEQKKLLKKMERLATTDPLTNTYNRRKTDELLFNEIDRYRRYQQPFAVVLCDIDYFKRINDTYGHDIGDKALVMVTDVLSKNIRSSDYIGRWGGEEFLLIFPGQKLQEAMLAAEKLRKLLAECNVDFINRGERITLSFGVAEITQGADFAALIKKADQALYLAKENGRNRVENAAK